MFDALADDNVRQYTKLDDIKTYGTTEGTTGGGYQPPSTTSSSSSSDNSTITGGTIARSPHSDNPHNDDDHHGMGLQHSTSSIVPLEGGALQSPSMAYSTGYFKFNFWFSVIFNIGLNAGLGYWGRDGKDILGLWDTPQPPYTSTTPVSSTKMALDMTLTCFFVVFFSTLIATPGIKAEIKKGKLAPVTEGMNDSMFMNVIM